MKLTVLSYPAKRAKRAPRALTTSRIEQFQISEAGGINLLPFLSAPAAAPLCRVSEPPATAAVLTGRVNIGRSKSIKIDVRGMRSPCSLASNRLQTTRRFLSPEPLVEVTRGGLTESRHRGHVIAVEPDGRVVAQLGARETVTFLRSSAKPHQAIPLLTSGAADRFGFNEREIALACASHNGEPIHTEVAAVNAREDRFRAGSSEMRSARTIQPGCVSRATRERRGAKRSCKTTVQANMRACSRWRFT